MSTPNGGDAGAVANSARVFWYGIWLIPTACWTDGYCLFVKHQQFCGVNGILWHY